MKTPVVQLAGLGVVLAAIMLGALALHIPGSDTVGSTERANVFVGVLAAGVAVYLLAVRTVLLGPMPRAAFWIVLAVAVGLRLVLLPSPPFLSSDIYRYVWDGQVQVAGVNPYLHLPADPSLKALRDPAVFPFINRAEYAPTIYPPAAQLVFALVGHITSSVMGMKIAMLGFETVSVLCLVRLLSLAGLPRERILIYLWNPLVLWSYACDGHVDAVSVALLSLALLARARHRDGLTGAILAAAALIKFLPVVVAPAFLRGRSHWRPAIVGLAVATLLYLPYLSAGRRVIGFLPGYGGEEGYADGSGFWLLAALSHLGPLPAGLGTLYSLCAAIGFGALALWIVRGQASQGPSDIVTLCRDMAVLAAFATAAANPHYAWYYAWLSLPCVLAPITPVIWLSAAPVLFYVNPFNERFFWPGLVFGPAVLLAARSLWQTRPHLSGTLAEEGLACRLRSP